MEIPIWLAYVAVAYCAGMAFYGLYFAVRVITFKVEDRMSRILFIAGMIFIMLAIGILPMTFVGTYATALKQTQWQARRKRKNAESKK